MMMMTHRASGWRGLGITLAKQFSSAYKHFILSQCALMNKICCADFDFAASFGFAASGFKILDAWAFALNASSQKTFCC